MTEVVAAENPEDIVMMYHPDLKTESVQTTRGALKDHWAEKGWRLWVDESDREVFSPPVSVPQAGVEAKQENKPEK